MIKFVAGRLLSALPTLLLVSLFVFLLVHAAPIDPVAQILGEGASIEDKRMLAEQLGLGRPVAEQYVSWLLSALGGDLGASLYTSLPVSQSIADGIGITLSLAVGGMAIALVIGIPLGVLGALRPGSPADRLLTVLVSVALAVPSFWLALLLALVFAVNLGWFPVIGYTPLTEDPVAWLMGLVLPTFALGVHTAAVIARQVRSAMIEALDSPYVQTLLARGIRRRTIVLRYATKNAMVPVLAVVAIQMSVLVAVSFVIERIFAVPGLGTLLMDSVVRADYPVLQGTIVVVAVIVLLVNLAADIAYGLINPKVRPQ
ncbi:ABC transporter permease [Streptosporangium sp. NBC_01755]|uniref:ABC transporter permease n=1 Tax=unclassified Streptosporangium TaxID=2632669 RepID=UPI002DDC622B|nr:MULTISPECIES: ABC transporter permease [unclassified Streptosporangium]WSA28307.1 ABC transporter permease [Streptosporangium sp. NBC_01810]WSD00215.1 ABC transporter permease [Streptosporangium sp. NBC_01755]